MNGFRGLSLTVSLILSVFLLPAAGEAQENPRDSRYTRDATKFLGLAMMQPDAAEREKMYQDALEALGDGFERDADNPKFWFTAGQVYVGLGEIEKAGEAFAKATELYPEYEAEIEGEMEAAWMAGFERGIELMDQQSFDSALAVFEAANALYPHRPEGWLNVGSIYANNKNDIEQAIHAFEQAIEAVNGPLLEQLDTASQEQWREYEELSAVNIAQMRGAQGVAEFEAERFEEAEAMFRQAAEINPFSRDYLFNIVQSQYARTHQFEDRIEADSTLAAELAPQLIPLYEQMRADIEKVQEFDPNNEALYHIMARATKRQFELAGDAAAAQQGAFEILTRHQELPVDVDQLAITPDAEGATAQISGEITTRSATPGSDLKIKVILLDRQGATIGEEEVTVTAPEPEATATFTVTSQATGQIAGWKYEVST